MPEGSLTAEFDAIVSAAHRLLKPRGYTKSEARFRRIAHGASVIVQFQKSAWHSPDDMRLTVNFAILSHRLARESGRDPSKIFDEAQGHARVRIGQFQPTPGDLWWSLTDPGDAETAIAELFPLLERGAAYCEAHASDDALAALWRRAENPAPGATEPVLFLRVDLRALLDI